MIKEADYIVVGAGSAGCVLASELSADPAVRVLVLESGPDDDSFLVDMPRGIGKLLTPGGSHVWSYQVSKGGNRGEETWMKGRAVGGSSSVNGMIYARGFAHDYDRWVELGCPGWGWSNMAPHFKAMEDHELGESADRGVGGPLRIGVHPKTAMGGDLCEAVLKAAEQAGLPRVPDTNAAPGGGIAYQPRNIWRGQRQSAAKAFLRPVFKRGNLEVVSGVDVRRITFDGSKAIGVEVRRGGAVVQVAARRRVIVCAGAIQSPKLLQLSGVGPAALLNAAGIEVVSDRAEVGRNLQEHYYITAKYRVTHGSLNKAFGGVNLLLNLLRYVVLKTGPMSHAAQELVGYLRSDPALAHPDCQIGVGLYSMGLGEKGLQLDKEPGVTLGGYYLHPKSRGEVAISSPDPEAAPRIVANYLSDPEDRERSVALLGAIRRIMGQPALSGIVLAELAPGPDVQSPDALLDYVLDNGGTAYHVAGTCRMGSDPAAVTDPQARVRGIGDLRVVDTSIFPELPSGNTNAPAMAAGRNVAAMIRGMR